MSGTVNRSTAVIKEVSYIFIDIDNQRLLWNNNQTPFVRFIPSDVDEPTQMRCLDILLANSLVFERQIATRLHLRHGFVIGVHMIYFKHQSKNIPQE
ncbi:hypothetical protein CO662_33260 [Rhizobium anhuiense]|uniref:Uncharacterized protein n=5 Tax=Rhizobium TaxID=379 RepID=A0A2A6J2H5_9HYPH|nr:hypothetical protein CO648_31280 [Rhizobium phaseoli]PCK76897.1 hypothetical protein CPT34_32945 [Rhizobium sophoriradicis]PDS33568.1 hypothetical protein CO665_35500 [Rhizobium anhuiense]PDS76280.1 hypothetical protein CO654_35180 [Rhizobium sp. L18]PDS94038.1 hypothetical protein CO659_31195 [Rhizobium sp. S9]PDT00043.1 hypothetical protein CO666_32860 [Rhizobium chutanense]PDT05001.1 hypothetical protein CO655_32875 [Rhizobium sp. M1]PDT09425.1 hypothetical protein CO670_31825 [Rhizobi